LENWINFDNLPRRKDGKVSWKDCNNNVVTFEYKGIIDCLTIVKRIDADTVLVNYNNDIFDLNILSLQRCSLGKLFNFSIPNNYHYSINDIINRDSHCLLILNQIRISYSNGKTSKGYRIRCLNCNNVFEISEANLERGDGCNVCSNHKIQIGKNDLWTTRPDIANMLLNKEDGYKYMQFSN